MVVFGKTYHLTRGGGLQVETGTASKSSSADSLRISNTSSCYWYKYGQIVHVALHTKAYKYNNNNGGYYQVTLKFSGLPKPLYEVKFISYTKTRYDSTNSIYEEVTLNLPLNSDTLTVYPVITNDVEWFYTFSYVSEE